MEFYDNQNFDGLKFLSQIKTHPMLAEPCSEFLYIINQLKSSSIPRSITVAEIGIGYGATALQVLKMLGKDDVYYCFDFDDTLNDFAEDLQARDFGIKCEVVTAGNSHREWDSYNWNLSEIVLQMRKQHKKGIFDAVYLDGAHTLLHDGLAVCLLKELLKDGGFLILDDLFWSYSISTSAKSLGWDKFMPKKQADSQQIFRVQELFLINDSNFENLSPPQATRGIFRKKENEVYNR